MSLLLRFIGHTRTVSGLASWNQPAMLPVPTAPTGRAAEPLAQLRPRLCGRARLDVLDCRCKDSCTLLSRSIEKGANAINRPDVGGEAAETLAHQREVSVAGGKWMQVPRSVFSACLYVSKTRNLCKARQLDKRHQIFVSELFPTPRPKPSCEEHPPTP